MTQSNKKIIIISSCVIVFFFLTILKLINNYQVEYHSIGWISFSKEEAVNNNVFLKNVIAKPKQFIFEDKKFLIKDSWVEKESFIKYRFLFFKKKILTGKYRLCFTLENVDFYKPGRFPYFVILNNNKTFSEYWKNGYPVYFNYLTTTNNNEFYINIRNRKDKTMRTDFILIIES
jgi:hypothetical protein